MRTAIPNGSLALLLTACVAVLPAQERRPLVGRVVDAAGTAVAGAQVTLVWTPPGCPESGAPEVIACTTDARGRFLARVRPQESYSAWAMATAADATVRASAVREGAAAGGDVELRLDQPARRRQVRIAGAEAWAAAGPLTVEVAVRARHITTFAVDADGMSPPLPSVGFALVRDAEERILCAQGFPRGSEADPLVVKLPPPVRTSFRITDPAGAPIASASVHHATSSSDARLVDSDVPFPRTGFQAWRRAGVTAADGTVTVDAPYEQGNARWPLLLRAPGMAETMIAWSCGTFMDVTMRRAARLRIHEDGATLFRPEIRLAASYCGAGFDLVRVVALRPDDSGICDLPIPLDPIETMLHVRARPEEPWQLRRISFASGEVTKIDLANQRRLALQLLDGSGGPARGLTGVLTAVGSPLAENLKVIVSTDQAGRIDRSLGVDAWLLVVDDGGRSRLFHIPRADHAAAPSPCETPDSANRYRLVLAGGR